MLVYLLSSIAWSVLGFMFGVIAAPNVTLCVREMFRQAGYSRH